MCSHFKFGAQKPPISPSGLNFCVCVRVLCGGKGYFPLESEYKEYLAKIPNSTEDKRKFKNMAVTGTVNCQCSHVFVLSCVDLHYGEKFANADKTLAMELEQHGPGAEEFDFTLRIETEDIDEVTTYDIACEYFVNLEERFKTHFPHLVPRLQRMRWGIPALHVQGHQDSCTYLFGTAYMECVGHFHGETAEQYWPGLNQLGPHVRQMNNGHRQDTMIVHHGDWNYKKTAQLASDLAAEILDAKKKYIAKRNHFIGLSLSFKDRVEKWRAMPRVVSKIGKEAVSVYKHRETKVPSQSAIFQKMLNDTGTFSQTMVPKNRVAQFMDESLKIQDLQRKVRDLISDTNEHDLQARRKEITVRTSKLRMRMEAWRKVQKELMPRVGDRIAEQTLSAPAIHDEKLLLPSDFSSDNERLELDIANLAAEEIRWREAQAFDALRAIQNIVKTISALRGRKIKNDRQQKQNTRAVDNILEATKLRDQHMDLYEIARQALIALNGPTKFPLLTESDLYMKPVLDKRRVGDSHRTDGALWRHPAAIPVEEAEAVSTTIISANNPGPHKQSEGGQPKQMTSAENRPDGWLWQLGKLTKLTASEMEEWSSEGDRVQWFRAEAEMQRWQEQYEQKLAELLRTRRSFKRMDQTWTTLAAQPSESRVGYSAYARQKAVMYRKRAELAEKLIADIGYSDLLEPDASLVERIQREREEQERVLAKAMSIS
ncbi:CxC2 domain-containing protein [Favolaschia claudopus]|uniref:CxC2 domain-containing protein n=1 Tax=Favolaschia claudopus TaxID=2862362 RepID=A0AAW0D5B6_9AGAR